jgi:hypothetical protein
MSLESLFHEISYHEISYGLEYLCHDINYHDKVNDPYESDF